MKRRSAAGSGRGFSLVEVVLAVGIVSTVLVAIVALLGSISQRSSEVQDRREISRAADALRAYLTEEVSFADVYAWISSGTKELGSCPYRADSDGRPSASGKTTQARWGENSSWEEWEAARDGRAVKAVLELDTSLTPSVSGGSLPPLGSFPEAYIVIRASLYPVPDLTLPLRPGDRPLQVFPVTVLRR